MEKVHRFRELFDKGQEKLGSLNLLGKFCLLVDASWEKFVYATSREDYFQYEFYKKNNRGRREFITRGRAKQIHVICNDPIKKNIFVEKDVFAEVFKDYTGRKILDMNVANFEEFSQFCATNAQVFQKPRGGTFGQGVSIINLTDVKNIKALYEELHGNDVILEEVIVQHPSLAAYNSTSLNSMRVVTILGADGEPEVMPGAVLRIGRKGKVADNFHHNGIASQIDIKTGMVCSTGIDKSGNRYLVHPDSGLPIIGFMIPMWDEICKTVLAAARVVPQVRFVGWDVAVTKDNRVILIEGNDRADPDVGQMSDGIGKWRAYEKKVNEIKAIKHLK